MVKFGFLKPKNAERLMNNFVRISRFVLLPLIYRGSLLEPDTYDKFCLCSTCVFTPLGVLKFKE